MRISGSIVVGIFVTFSHTYVFIFVLYAKREVCYFIQGLCKGWFANLQDIKVNYKVECAETHYLPAQGVFGLEKSFCIFFNLLLYIFRRGSSLITELKSQSFGLGNVSHVATAARNFLRR